MSFQSERLLAEIRIGLVWNLSSKQWCIKKRDDQKDSEQVGMTVEVMVLKTKIGISRSVSAILTNL